MNLRMFCTFLALGFHVTAHAGAANSAYDTDFDGVPNAIDNCVLDPNADQRDTDNDGTGNVCDADFNDDCMVNFVDAAILRADFLTAGDLDTDLTGDGLVNNADLLIFKQKIFAPPGPSGLQDLCGYVKIVPGNLLTASSAGAFDEFGRSVATKGQVAVIGAFNAGDQERTGEAYVFARDADGSDAWQQVQRLTASDAYAGDRFGFSVALDTDIVMVGASDDNEMSGAVYVFYPDQGAANQWVEVAKLTANEPIPGSYFGWEVAVRGDFAVVSAPVQGAGVVYVFSRDAATPHVWREVRVLAAFDGVSSQRFGDAVGISSNTIAVGAWRDHQMGITAGAVYLFENNSSKPGDWTLIKKLTAPDAASGQQFGTALSLDENTLVVGAPGGAETGAGYVFYRDLGGANNWGLAAKITGSEPEGFIGRAIAVNGDTLVAGHAFDDAAQVHGRHVGGTDSWGRIATLRPQPETPAARATAAEQRLNEVSFGDSVAVDDDTVLVGAPLDEQAAGERSGSAYVYIVAGQSPPQ